MEYKRCSLEPRDVKMKGLAIIDSNPAYIVSSQWPETNDHNTFTTFSIHVTDCHNSWTTNVDPSYLSMIKPAGIDDIQFSQLTFASFCPGGMEQSSLGTPFLSANVSDDKSDLTIYWKLKQPQGLSIVLGSVRLKPCESGSIGTFADLFSFLNQIQVKNKELQTELNTQLSNIDGLKNSITEKEDAQKQWESVVFTRFKDVLNAKKRKIRELQKIIATNGQPAPTIKDGSETEMSETDGDQTELDE